MKCPGCGTEIFIGRMLKDGTRLFTEEDADATVHTPSRCAAARLTPADRERLRALVEAAKRVIDLYDEDQMDSLGFAARRMTAMTALRAALAEVDRG